MIDIRSLMFLEQAIIYKRVPDSIIYIDVQTSHTRYSTLPPGLLRLLPPQIHPLSQTHRGLALPFGAATQRTRHQ